MAPRRPARPGSPPMRANTWWRISRSRASVGFGLPASSPPRSGMFIGKAAGPAGSRQRAGRLQCRLQRRLQHRAGGNKLLDPPLQAAGARSAALGAEQPATQFRGLQAGQFGGERPVRRIEHVVAFVEHVAGRNRAVVEPAPRGLGHHQGMVGNDKLRAARPADRVFDEAAPPVRAGGMDAFAAPVRKAEDGGRAEQFGEPAGQVAALDVAIGRDQRPAGNQAERNDRGRRQPRSGGAQRVLQVEQAEVILPALAHHDALVPFGRVREQVGQFCVDLALQVAGESADPHAAVVLLGPHAGGREVAERLARPGAGLGQHEMRIAAGLARREGRGGGTGIVGLARPLLGMRSQHAASRARASVSPTGCAEGGGSGAVSSHSGRRFQTRSASFDGAASGLPSAAVTNGAQPQPASPMRAAKPAASRFRAMSRPSESRCSNAAASSGSSAASTSRPPVGDSKSSIRARPRGVGAAGRAGNAKANNSNRSNAGMPRRPSLRNVAGA